MTIALLSYVCGTVAIGSVLLWTLRWLARRSPVVATIVGLGVAARLSLAAALFWVSFLRVGMLRTLHTGDGFWQLAPDALSYFLRAADAWERGLSTIDPAAASPSYVLLLSRWMFLTGPTVPGGVLMNVAAYVLTCVLLVTVLDPRRGLAQSWACAVSIGAFTFSPASILFGSQTLKDVPFTLFIVVTCVAVLLVLGDWRRVQPPWVGHVFAFTGLGTAAYMLAGMRPYFPFLQVFAMVPAIGASAWRLGRAALSPVRVAVAPSLIAVTWVSFALGAGPSYYTYERLVVGDRAGVTLGRGSISRASSPSEAVDSAREGFVRAGGATNIVWRHHRATRLGKDAGFLARSIERATTVALGLLVTFVPISILRVSDLIEFQGGRGLLLVTDLDTVYLVGSSLVVGFLMWRHWWPEPRNVPYVVFVVGFAGILALLMAYVVTNFGTLFRLRLMVAALIWTTPLALARSQPEPWREPRAGAPGPGALPARVLA